MCAEYAAPSLVVVARRMKRRWKQPAVVFAAMLSLVLVITMILPNRYESHLKLLVKNERLNPMVSSGQQTQGVTYVNEVSEARINTEIELLTSADVLRRVVERSQLSQAEAISKKPASVRAELALDRLRKDLSVSAVRKSDVIEVTYRSRDPKQAEVVLQNLAEVYLDAHLALHGAPGSDTFLRQIYERSSQDLSTAEAKLNDFKESHHVTSLGDEKSLLLQEIAGIERGIADSSSGATRAGEETLHLERLVSATPQTIEKERQSVPNQASSEQLDLLLVTLKNKRTEAAQRYRADDRVIEGLDAQIAQTEASLQASRDSKAQEVSTGINPTYLSAQGEYLKASTDFVGNRAQMWALQKSLAEARAKLASLDAATGQYDDLQRHVTETEAVTALYKRQSDQAHVDGMLDRQRIANVTVAEAPTRAELPSSPKRGLILSFGFIWSIFAACGTALALDLSTERVCTPFELEQIPDLPLLACVPAAAAPPARSQAFSAVYTSVQRRIVGGL